MTTGTRTPVPEVGLDKAAKYATIVSAVASTGNLVLGATGGVGLIGGGLVSVQTFAAITIVVAFGIYLFDWERKRDKWPGRLSELTRRVLPFATTDPKFLPPDFMRALVLVYMEYHRMSLAEGRKDLAKDFEKEIDHWQLILDKSESLSES